MLKVTRAEKEGAVVAVAKGGPEGGPPAITQWPSHYAIPLPPNSLILGGAWGGQWTGPGLGVVNRAEDKVLLLCWLSVFAITPADLVLPAR